MTVLFAYDMLQTFVDNMLGVACVTVPMFALSIGVVISSYRSPGASS